MEGLMFIKDSQSFPMIPDHSLVWFNTWDSGGHLADFRQGPSPAVCKKVTYMQV